MSLLKCIANNFLLPWQMMDSSGQEGPAENTGPNPLVRLLDPTPLTPEETGTLRNILWDRAEEIFRLTPGQFVEDETLVENLADTITDHFEELTQVDAFEEHCKLPLASLTRDGFIEGNRQEIPTLPPGS